MSGHEPAPADVAQLRAGLEARARAVRARDPEALLAWYAPEVHTFDLLPPLSRAGAGSVRERVTEWLSSFASPIDYEISAVEIHASGDVAFDHHLTRVRGTTTSGDHVSMWFRETVGYRRAAGRWIVVHQHSSVPFEPRSGSALLGLEPG